ncbi:MAG: DUF1566 domain-containing protein [Pseudomonadales bacterium]|nr:DUF1566 domain-containing protein [Pseudomonadales bacterium]
MIKKRKTLAVLIVAAAFFSSSLLAEQQCNASIDLAKPDSIYTDHYDGTVSDNTSGLMWQKCSVGQTWLEGDSSNDGSDDHCDTAVTLPYKRAVAAADNANAAEENGYTDWRLPSLVELQTLVEGACFGPSINEKIFPDSVSGFYWTATADDDNSSNAWHLSFILGFEVSGGKNFYYYARLVRDD